MSKNCKHLKQKLNRKLWCIYYNKEITFSECSFCKNKEYLSKGSAVLHSNSAVSHKAKLTKATDIPTKLKKKVWERDNHRCIFCNKPVTWNYANSHYIKRSQLGLGIEENIMTNCDKCHKLFESSSKRNEMKIYASEYFKSLYPNWNEDKLKYKKYN